MSKKIVQPEVDRSHEEFLLELADLYFLLDDVLDAAPNQSDIGEPATEAGFMEWGRRYQSVAGVAEGLFTHIPDVGDLEMPSFEQMWAEA